jgi:succinate dehydrogenase / fumarate reductase membrane anchor subunit
VNLVTPLNRVLGLGNAKGGAAEHWWVQRLTAVALVLLGLWFAIELALLDDFSYRTVAAWVARPYSSVMLILFVIAAGYHSYLGVRVVIEDYVHGKGARVVALLASTFAHAALTVAALFAILRVAFGPTL